MVWEVKPTPLPLFPRKGNQYPLCKKLGAGQGRFERVRKKATLPSFEPRFVHPVASCYSDQATPVKQTAPTLLLSLPGNLPLLYINVCPEDWFDTPPVEIFAAELVINGHSLPLWSPHSDSMHDACRTFQYSDECGSISKDIVSTQGWYTVSPISGLSLRWLLVDCLETEEWHCSTGWDVTLVIQVDTRRLVKGTSCHHHQGIHLHR
jgi:hypothetical protein